MAVNVRTITLWRAEVDNKPGTLAQTLRYGFRRAKVASISATIFGVSGRRLRRDVGVLKTPRRNIMYW